MSEQVPNLGLKYWKLRARKLTLHLINVAEINAQQNERDLNNDSRMKTKKPLFKLLFKRGG